MLVILGVCFTGLALRVVQLQAVDPDRFVALSNEQTVRTQTLAAAQGLVLGLLNIAGLRPEDDDPEAADPIAVDEDLDVSAPADLRLVPEPDERADSSDLAIPGYDTLSAFQVMPRLEGLGPDELEAVRAYERGTRGRQTILNKIAQLQAS